MKFFKTIISILPVILILSSCNNIDFKKTKGNVPYKIMPGSGGDKIVIGNIIKYQMTVKAKDSVLYTSYESLPQYEQVGAPSNSYESPLMEIFGKAKKGDSIYFVQSIDSFIAHNPEIVQKTPFRKGDQLKTSIKILNVFRNPNDAQKDYMNERVTYSVKAEKEGFEKFKKDRKVQEQVSKDDKIIEDYLKTNNIHADKTAWGTYVQVLQPGTGPKPSSGKFVSIRYKGTNLKGEEFDSNMNPAAPVLPLQIGTTGSIIGFEDGVKQMNKGEKARLFIPSSLAYGPAGRQPKILPNEILLFDIEVTDISDTRPEQKQMPIKIDTAQTHK